MKTEFVSKLPEFLSKLSISEGGLLLDIASRGVELIKEETPVKTGKLQAGNEADIKGNRIWFQNSVFYAKFQELGTMFIRANAFMRRGIARLKPEIKGLCLRRLHIRNFK